MNHLSIVKKSPVGELVITRNKNGICRISFGSQHYSIQTVSGQDDSLLKLAGDQLEEYFAGGRTSFELPLAIAGTAFQNSVWSALRAIPYGETRSYQEIAEQTGNIKAVRAVGQANKVNPLPIIIPCHRVIGKNKKLTGYAGKQLDKKEILLKTEGAL